MAKIQIKSEKLTPFGGIFSIMEQFDSILSSVIDSTLGLRCKSFGYRYSEIIRSLMSISDTILRAIKELTQENVSYTSDTGKNYDFNTADTLNTLLLNCMFASGQLKEGEMYDVDFGHQFIETEKYDAKPTYKKFSGYRPGVAVIGDLIVGIVRESESKLSFLSFASSLHCRYEMEEIKLKNLPHTSLDR